MLREELEDNLKQFIPVSDMVKATLLNENERAKELIEEHGWGEYLNLLAEDIESGNRDALFELLNIVYLGAHNEGLLEGIDINS